MIGSDLAKVDAHVIRPHEYEEAPELTDAQIAGAFNVQDVVRAVQIALGGRVRAALHAPPTLTYDDQDRIGSMIGREPVGYRWVQEFEERIARRIGVRHAVAVSSGTAALHLALRALGIDQSSNVYVPALTFAGAAAAVRYCGASPWFYPHAGERYEAQPDVMIDVDLLGIPSGNGVNDKWPTVHDAAQSLGGINGIGFNGSGTPCGKPEPVERVTVRHQGWNEYEYPVHTGVSILSFNSNKIITTGGGGMVLTDDDAIAERVRYLATTAKVPSPHHYVHTEVGYNYRMPNACAALGLVMLDKLDDILFAKARLHQAYREAFRDVPGVTMVEAPAGVTWNHWLNAIEVPVGQRDATLQALTDAGYECRALYTPLPWLEPYKQFARGQTFPEAERRFAVTVCLPSGPELAQ